MQHVCANLETMATYMYSCMLNHGIAGNQVEISGVHPGATIGLFVILVVASAKPSILNRGAARAQGYTPLVAALS